MKIRIPDLHIDIDSLADKLKENSRAVLITGLTVLMLTIAACLVAFSLSVKGSEQVMVPDLEGKELSVALLEMQAKELYPKIQLRYSDSGDDKGFILDQSPSPGSIVKAGRRISLVVSRGIIVDRVENFVGQNVDDVAIYLQTLFTSMATPLLTIGDKSLYRFNTSPAGTILEQEPLPDTPLTGPTQLKFVVSKGPENDKVSVPSITGLSITETLIEMCKSEVIFDFTPRAPEGQERAGTVVSQMPASGARVSAYSRVQAVVALPVKSTDGRVYGVFKQTLPVYPYPFQIKLEAVTPKGERLELVTMKHPGGDLSVPYAVEDGTVLVLTILNKEAMSVEIHENDDGSTSETIQNTQQ
jgi:eukaryotic-like serine/threonine-protein kinase